MSLPDKLEYAYPGGSEEPCIRRVGAEWMLCGRKLTPRNRMEGFVPVAQPVAPANVHPECVRLAADLHGVCPVCGGDVATLAGRLVAHGRHVVTRDGVERSDLPCGGAGQVPEAES